MTMPRGVDERLVILDIDEKSLGEIGRWPWSRRLMAELVDKLFDRYGVAVLGFDVVWAERDPSSGVEALDALAGADLKTDSRFQSAYSRLRPSLDFDRRFAASMKGRPVVLGYYFNFDERAVKANALPPPVLPSGTFEGRSVDFPLWIGYTGNLPVYCRTRRARAHQSGVRLRRRAAPRAAGDRIRRRVLRGAVARGGARAARAQTGKPPRSRSARTTPRSWNGCASAAADSGRRGRRGADALSAARRFRYVSLADVVKDRVAPRLLKGKIVLIGTTAPTLQDMRATPVARVFPGVEIHANMIAGILDEAVKKRPQYVVGAEIALLLIGGIVFAFLIPRLSALWATLVTAIGIALIAGFNLMVWHFGLVLPLAASLLIATTIYVLNMAYGYFVESRSKRQLADRFGEYVPPELVDQMARDPGRYSMAPKSAELTILFSDVRGFTGISESLEPDALREYIDAYLTEMSMIIRSRYRGTLDKYIGDAIMAFWGAPVEDAQHARNAVLAALAMHRQCAPLNARFAQRGWPALKIGIGVNSGTVRVGEHGLAPAPCLYCDGGRGQRRLAPGGRTKAYGVGILVGEATRSRVQDVVFREIDRVKVKGKTRPSPSMSLSGMEGEISQGRAASLERGAARLSRARLGCRGHEPRAPARHESGLRLYGIYLQKVQDKRRNPPPSDWDGVTVFDDK
jgi:adenylate cyclase